MKQKPIIKNKTIGCPKCNAKDFEIIDNEHCKCRKCNTQFNCEMLEAQDEWTK